MNTPNKNYAELGNQRQPDKEPKSVLEAMSMQSRLDNWYNPVSGFGMASKARMPNVYFSGHDYIDREQAEDMYRGDWAAKKSIDLPVFDMFREGIDWMEDEGQEPVIDQVEDEFERLDFINQLKLNVIEAWKQGGGLIFVSFDDPLDAEEELNPNLVRGIKRLDVIPGGRNGLAQEIEWDSDFDSPTRGEPTHYLITLNHRTVSFTKKVHASRCIRIDSPFETSNLSRQRNAGWNDSRFQSVYKALASMQIGVKSGEETFENFTYQILKTSGLADAMKKASNVILDRKLQAANDIKAGRTVLIGEGEELTKVGTPLTGFHELATQHTKYFTAATWIPHSRFFNGESGALGGDTMDGELKNYYDWIGYLRPFQLKRPIKKMIEFISYYLNFDPKKLDFDFPALNQLTALQQAQLYANMAQADSLYINNQVVTPEEVAVSRFSGKEFDHTSMHVDFNDPSREEDMLGAGEAEDVINGKDQQNPMEGEEPKEEAE